MLLTHHWLRRPAAVGITAIAALALPGVAPGFAAVSASSPVVINEIYGGGGNSGSVLTHDFVELYNTSSAPVDVSTWSVQYASAAGTTWSGLIPLTGSIPAHSTYLVQAASQTGASTVSNLPTPDASSSAVNLAAANGNVAVVSSATKLTCVTTTCAGDPAVVDLVGYGTGAAYAGAGPAPAPSASTSITRTAKVSTASNVADFVTGAPTPTAATTIDPTPTPTPTPTTSSPTPTPTATSPTPTPTLTTSTPTVSVTSPTATTTATNTPTTSTPTPP